MVIKQLSEEIKKEVFSKLDEIYNYRKQKLGLVSAHNTLINELKRLIIKWVKEKEEWENTQASPKKARSHNSSLKK